MQLRFISIPLLIGEAGGDPWAINNSLQVGRPAQIADLAEAFHAAGRCTIEAGAAFEQARRRFEAAWNRENGEHPINDSAEVQRVTQALGAQSLQLPKIGVDLETSPPPWPRRNAPQVSKSRPSRVGCSGWTT